VHARTKGTRDTRFAPSFSPVRHPRVVGDDIEQVVVIAMIRTLITELHAMGVGHVTRRRVPRGASSSCPVALRIPTGRGDRVRAGSRGLSRSVAALRLVFGSRRARRGDRCAGTQRRPGHADVKTAPGGTAHGSRLPRSIGPGALSPIEPRQPASANSSATGEVRRISARRRCPSVGCTISPVST
jgi:hypothetical protein